MVSLAEQTKNVFGEKPIEIPTVGLPAPLPDPYSPEISAIRKKMILEDIPKQVPKVIKGAALSIPAIPSDLVDLAKLANDLNNQYGPDFITKSPVTKFFTRAVDKTQKAIGREQFSKLMKTIGINDNPNDPAQLIGELSTVLIGLPLAVSKVGTKGGKEGLKQIPLKQTAIDKPKQTAISTKVDDTAPKDPSRRKFMKGVAGTAGAITAAPLIKASSLIPKADIATAIQKSYQSLVPAIQNFRAEKFVLNDNLDTFFDLRDSGNIQDKFFKIKQATDSAGKPMQQYYEYDYDTETQNLEELKNKNIADKEALKIGLDKHTQILEDYKKQISADLNIPLSNVIIVKNKREGLKDYKNIATGKVIKEVSDIQDLDLLSSAELDKGGLTTFARTHFNDLNPTGNFDSNQAWLTPDGVVVTNQQRLQGMIESVSNIRNPKKHIQIKQDLNTVVKEYKELLNLIFDNRPDYKKFGSQAQYEFYGYDDATEELIALARDIESKINPNVFEKIMYSIVDGKATKMSDLGMENFKDGKISYFVDKFYSYFAKEDANISSSLESIDGIFKIFNFMNNPNLNNMTNKKIIFLKDFYDGNVYQRYINQLLLQLDNVNEVNIFDKLDLNMKKAFKPVRTTIGSKSLYKTGDKETILDTGDENVIQDHLANYSGTGMYESDDIGFPTQYELNLLSEDRIDRITNLDDLYAEIKRILPNLRLMGEGDDNPILPDLDAIYTLSKTRDLRIVRLSDEETEFKSDKLLSFLKYFNSRNKPNLKEGVISGTFVPPKDKDKFDFDYGNARIDDGIYKLHALLKNRYMNLVKYKGMPVEKARDLVNKEFKKAVNVSYIDRLYKYSQTKFGKIRMSKEALNQMQKKYLEQAKLLDVSLPTTGLDSQLAINFSKGNKYFKANDMTALQDRRLPQTQQLYQTGEGRLRYPYDESIGELINSIELSADEIAKSLGSNLKKVYSLTDQTTKMLKGADKAITALEAPKVKYTKDVYHLGKGEIVGDKFDFMGDSDIGVHVGTQTHAKAAAKKYFVEKGDVTNDPTVDFTPDKNEDVLQGGQYKVKGQRTFPLQLADDLKPARVPDIGLFKEPRFWIYNLTIPSNDPIKMDLATTDAKGNESLEAMSKFQKKPKINYKGVTYYMSDKAVDINMDEKLWEDFVKAAVDEQAKRKKLKIYGSKERKEWFEKLKKITNNNGYDSFIYKNEKEATETQRATDSLEDSFMLFEPDQIKYKFAKTQTKGDPRLDRYKGGMI